MRRSGRDNGLAWLKDGPEWDGARAGFVWLGGFMSDMAGAKAEALAAHAERMGRPCLRFDYSGHGQSEGAFTGGTISAWLEESAGMIARHTRGPAVLVGSSMGSWLAAMAAPRLGARAAGLVLIAPAHDFTETLMWDLFDAGARAEIMERGVWLKPSGYGGHYPITRGLIEDGRRHLMLGSRYDAACPVHIVQGDADADVPWAHAKKVYDDIAGGDVRFTLIKGGDHRLSRPEDIAFILSAAEDMAARVR